MAYSKSLLTERTRLGADTDRKDFFYYLLNARDPETGQGFSNAELWGESNLLIIAGSDTTSTSLAGTFFYLSHNPSALAKATAEVRGKFSDVEEISNGPALNSCTYVRACIDEAMRLSPPVGGILPRQVLPGGLSVDGEEIPEGTVVGVPHYTIHHNSLYYPDPFAYKPERWIPNSKSEDSIPVTHETVALAQSAFCPFSVGPRGCIGKGLAYVELMTTVVRTLFLYDMRLAPGEKLGEGNPNADYGRQRPGEFQLQDTFTSMKDGPLVQFRERS
jgi:cytochrome P450